MEIEDMPEQPERHETELRLPVEDMNIVKEAAWERTRIRKENAFDPIEADIVIAFRKDPERLRVAWDGDDPMYFHNLIYDFVDRTAEEVDALRRSDRSYRASDRLKAGERAQEIAENITQQLGMCALGYKASEDIDDEFGQLFPSE